MSDLFFDPPWWLPLGVVAVGVYLFWTANRKQDTTLRNIGLGVVGLAVLLMAVAYFVDSDKETVVKKSRALVSSVEKRDWATFATLLDRNTVFLPMYKGKQALVDGVPKSIDRIGLKSVNITSLQAEQHQSLITVNLSVLSDQDVIPYPTPTNWRLSWQNGGDGWYLQRIEPLASPNVTPDEVTRQLVP